VVRYDRWPAPRGPSEAERIKFGADLRRWREQAGLTQQQLARAVPLSQAQVSSIERGAKGTGEEQVRRFDQILNTEGALMARWHNGRRYGLGYAAWFSDIVAVEAQATLIREFQSTLIPGLLQTEDYAQVIIRSGIPLDSDAEIDTHVRGRLDRQQLLMSSLAPWYQVVLDEPWLHRPTGGRAVMRGQLEHLVKMSLEPRISIQVIPTATEFHAGHDGPFKLFTVPKKGTIAYTETRTSGHPEDDPSVLEDYTKVFTELRGAALPVDASRELLIRIIGELNE
jgi:transcriptional regulator with XRE-family HTH domain